MLLNELTLTNKFLMQWLRKKIKNFFTWRLFVNWQKSNVSAIDWRALSRDGYITLEGWIDKNHCDELSKKLRRLFDDCPDVVKSSDDLRLFGVEFADKDLGILDAESVFQEGFSLLGAERVESFFTLGGLLTCGNKGSSGGGWHRDSFFGQYKAIVYLTDVNTENGPLELIAGSHKFWNIIKFSRFAPDVNRSTRVDDEVMNRLIREASVEPRLLTGGRGTVILFNSSTLHRGRPILKGERLSLTSYYYPISWDRRTIFKKFGPMVCESNKFDSFR